LIKENLFYAERLSVSIVDRLVDWTLHKRSNLVVEQLRGDYEVEKLTDFGWRSTRFGSLLPG